MEYKLAFKSSVGRDLKKIDQATVKALLDDIENELVPDPGKGKQLRGEFEGLYSYRFRDYRVVYTVLSDTLLVLRIRHRKDVYR